MCHLLLNNNNKKTCERNVCCEVVEICYRNALTGYVRRMQKAAESVKALSQNDFRGCLEDWRACMERCVASHGSCCEVENT
jgi:hypothetical protein